MKKYYTVFYKDFETYEQPPAYSVQEVMAQIAQYPGEATRVVQISDVGSNAPLAFKDVSAHVALLMAEQAIKDGIEKGAAFEPFVDLHTSEKDIQELWAEHDRWKENPA